MRKPKIPDAAIKRLPIYLRVLQESAEVEVAIISSAELASKTGFTPEQIRKDLAYFGAFGTRGVGYDVVSLSRRITRILGLHRGVDAALVGAGHLGVALARYNLSRHKDVRITAIFDVAPAKIGTELMGVTIQPLAQLVETIRERGIRIAILAVPASEAQNTAELLEQAGIEAILNFAPAKIRLNPVITVQNIDLTIELQSLAYYTSASDESEAEVD
ncbi:MAG TPA: redox-sensing transcriptional repressor Rex [Symbiobacteriaceae bacterium]|nr:redox-sensing transcriptional repressor Rex [Symbiobacteriaceae bacterium]